MMILAGIRVDAKTARSEVSAGSLLLARVCETGK
jgi:hypothetical protein